MDAEQVTTITFEKLLPPQHNTEIVAAQGLLHVLSLATKGLIDVEQNEAFGDIDLSIVSAITAESDGGDVLEGGDEPVED